MHRRLGELAIDVLGADAVLATGATGEPYDLTPVRSACSSTAAADTIYGGSNQIQRNIIGERVLGLPPEPKVIG